MKKRSPLFTIAAHEYVMIYRDRIVMLLAMIAWILLAAAAYTGWERGQQTALQKNRAAAMFRHEWEEQQANPHSAAHFGTYLFKPNTFLSIYDYGLNRYLGVTYRVEAHVQHEVNQAEAQATDSQLRFGELSVSMVLQLLMPLLILLITYSTITREREGNTLPLLLMQGIQPKQLIWGKIAGNYAIVLTIVIPAFILLGLPVFQQGSQPDIPVRYGLFAAAYLVYFFVFTSIGTLVSAWSRSSGAAMVACIGIWFLLSVLAPRLTARLIDEGHPLPSRYELNKRIAQGYSKGMNGDGTSIQRHQRYLDSTLKKYGVDSVKQLPVNFDGLSMQYGEDYNTKVYEHYNGEVEEIIELQQEQLEKAGLGSPFIAIQQVSMGLSGSDYYHHRSFHHQAKKYRDEFIRILNMNLANSGAQYLTYDYKAGPDFFKRMKDFTYNPPPAKNAVAWHHLAWLALGAWCVLVMILVNLTAKQLIKIKL